MALRPERMAMEVRMLMVSESELVVEESLCGCGEKVGIRRLDVLWYVREVKYKYGIGGQILYISENRIGSIGKLRFVSKAGTAAV